MSILDWLKPQVKTTILDGDGNFVHEETHAKSESGENPFGGKWGWLIEMAAIAAKHREEDAERQRMKNEQYAKTGTFYKPDYQAKEDGMSWHGRGWGKVHDSADCKDTYTDGT